MMNIEIIKINTAKGLGAGNFEQFQQANIALLRAHFPHYHYADFRQQTNRATKPLNSFQQLLAYQAFYGTDHFNRFCYLLKQLPLYERQDKTICLKIFDYGCGQGLATLALLQHLQQKKQRVNLEIHLIEPSTLALDLAQHYVQLYAATHLQGHIKITEHPCSLDQLDNALFKLHDQQWAVHLFSNVLDMACSGVFNLKPLMQQWQMMQGKQICLAVSPNCLNTQQGFQTILQQHANTLVAFGDFSCPSIGYREMNSQYARLRQYHVKGKMLAFTVKPSVQRDKVV